MEIKDIVENLKYYTEDLPKEALKEAIENKKKMIPELLKMLEYTKENLEKIFNEEDDFFGYTYAYFLLAEFKEKKVFPYLIDLINKGEEYLDYILGDNYTDYLPRLLASTYNGDDQALFDIIENKACGEFIRSCALHCFAILYLNNVKTRDFFVNYLKKLIIEKDENDNSYLYLEVLYEASNLKLIELKEDVENLYTLIENGEERNEIRNELEDGKEINRFVYPIVTFYEYMYNTIEIMEDWQCFCNNEDKEFLESEDYEMYEYEKMQRAMLVLEKKRDIGRNDLCFCGSGKKYKKCCINKTDNGLKEKLDFIDYEVCKAMWLLKNDKNRKAARLLRLAWYETKEICKNNQIKSIEEYDYRYRGYDFLLNWIQEYDRILESSGEKEKLYERLELWNSIEDTFDLSAEDGKYWKEEATRAKANVEFNLGNEEKATQIIEEYLKVEPSWTWGYIEMADWYFNKRDKKHYNLEKAKEILLRAEKFGNEDDVDAAKDRLYDIYNLLDDKDTLIQK